MAFNEVGLYHYSIKRTYSKRRYQYFRVDIFRKLANINPSAQLEELKRVLDEVSLELDYEDIGEKLPAQNR